MKFRLLFLLAPAVCASVAPAQVLINEVMYDPPDATKPVEFIELHNAGAAAVSIGLWRFEEAVDCIIPAGTSIAAGGYYVVAQDAAAFQAQFGFAPGAVYSGKLSSQGERIRLLDSTSTLVDEVDYGVGFPWPTATNGQGSSMELIHPSLDNSLGGSWRASGTAAAAEAIIPAGDGQWHWRPGNSEASSPVETWRTFSFVEDATWSGNATLPLGYGDIDGNAGNTDVATTITGMQNSYWSVFLRRTFTIAPGQVPATLALRLRADDAVMAWLNGVAVPVNVRASGQPTYNGAGMTITNVAEPPLAWENEITIPNAQSVLQSGTNVLALMVFNSSLGSSDLFIDAELRLPVPAGGSPGQQNSAYSAAAPPAIRQVTHTPELPAAGVPVVISAKVTDPQGVAAVTAQYQVVNPGSYIRKVDAAYATGWTSLTMQDDGQNGDALAGDGIFSVTVPGSVQTHRRLVRYRISATDGASSVTVPYADDGQPNFAYFCYSGMPAWTGRNQPPSSAATIFPATLMGTLPAYHLIADGTDVTNSQWNGSFDTLRMWGTLVYEGKVYDHILFHNKGSASTYQSGKNKWRFHFNTGRDFEARDTWGRRYNKPWDTFTMHACATPWNPVFRGWAGLDEVVSTRVYQLSGVPSPNMHHLQFRVVDGAEEAPPDQYLGDVWGLYLAVEDPDGSFLDERGLPDGNVYHIAGNAGDKTHQGETQPAGTSDWDTFLNGSGTNTEAWWRANMDLEAYFSFHAGNRITGNVDLREGWNHYFYHRGTDNRWLPVPWDLDMMYFPETHWSGTIAQQACRNVPAIALEFRNRCREIMDLLCEDGTAAGGQIGQLVAEYKRVIRPPGQAAAWDLLDQYMWNYNPRSTGGHSGRFYLPNPSSDGRIGGNWTRTYSTADFNGICDYLVAYATDTDPNSFAVGDGDQRGYGFNYLEQEGTDAAAPNRPALSFSGTAGFPANDLRFTASAFSDPQGAGTFGSMQWRVGEIAAPGIAGYVADEPFTYEISEIHRSLEITPFAADYRFPVSTCRPGHTYRARVRMKDATGRWSRWSPAVQFLVSAPEVSVYQNALAITEVMYHPTGAVASELANGWTDDDFEYIELRNMSALPVDLTDVRFTKGIDFDFPAGFILQPGAATLVVRNASAFAARYGSGRPVAGAWGAAGGRLGNDGEEIKLSYGAGTQILSFLYTDADPWPGEADGSGSAMHFIAGAGVPSATPGAWFATAPSPGVYITDTDADGQSDAEEYLAGTRPADGSSRFAITGASTAADGLLTATFPALAGHTYRVFRSTDGQNWAPLGADLTAGNDGPLQFTDSTGGRQRSFYKVRTPAQ